MLFVHLSEYENWVVNLGKIDKGRCIYVPLGDVDLIDVTVD